MSSNPLVGRSYAEVVCVVYEPSDESLSRDETAVTVALTWVLDIYIYIFLSNISLHGIY